MTMWLFKSYTVLVLNCTQRCIVGIIANSFCTLLKIADGELAAMATKDRHRLSIPATLETDHFLSVDDQGWRRRSLAVMGDNRRVRLGIIVVADRKDQRTLDTRGLIRAHEPNIELALRC